MAAAAAAATEETEEVLRAEDIAPSAFAAADASLAAELATLGVRRPDDLEYDEANLTAWDSHPVDKNKLRKATREKYLARRARDSVQLLLHKVFALPYEPTPDGPMAVLPRPKILLPRRLPVPAARAETKWEAFAKEKGIKKQKRSRMVYEEATGEWKPRWGYQRANDDTKDWLVPVKGGEDPDKNPFEERAMKKKERVLKNKLQNLRNEERAETDRSRKGGASRSTGSRSSMSAADEIAAAAASLAPVGIPKSLKASEGDVSGLTGQGRQKRPRPGGESKADKGKKVRAAQVATASMGRFDRRLPGEPEPPRDRVRHKKRATTPAGAGEHSRDLAVLSSVMHTSGKGAATAGTSSSSSSAAGAAGAGGSRVFRGDKRAAGKK